MLRQRVGQYQFGQFVVICVFAALFYGFAAVAVKF